MPPRKKPRRASVPASVVSVDTRGTGEEVSVLASAADDGPAPTDLPLELWTDEEEISLFKGIIKWKPAGMHKHFRMVAISQYMMDRGHNPLTTPHMRIPGLWRKLQSLYNLDTIDERENSIFEIDEDVKRPQDEPYRPFALPEREFGERMFGKRLAVEASSSPSLLENPRPALPRRTRGGRFSRGAGKTPRDSTVEEAEEERRSSVVTATSPKPARTTRSAKATPQSGQKVTPKQAPATKKRRKAEIEVEEAKQEDVTGTEVDAEEDEAPGNSSTADSPASGRGGTVSKGWAAGRGRGGGGAAAGRGGTGRAKATPDLRRSTRNR